MTTTQQNENHGGGGGPGDVIRMPIMRTAMSDKQDEIKCAILSEKN